MKNDLLITNQKIRQKWNNSYRHTPAIETKFIVGTQNNRNFTKELVRPIPYFEKTVENKIKIITTR
jgi:hypothetical protein